MKKKWTLTLTIFSTIFAGAFVLDTVQTKHYYSPLFTGEEVGEMPIEQLSTSGATKRVREMEPFRPREYIRIHSPQATKAVQ